MNPDTGHLIALRRDEKLPEGYERLHDHLALEARRKLARELTEPADRRFWPVAGTTAQVNLSSRTPLAQWAKKKRMAKIAAASRRRNRHGKR